MALVERRLDQFQMTGLPLATPALRAADGRRDFFHFWFYPALAAPGIWLASAAGLDPNVGFVPLNVVMLMGALWVVSRRAAWWITAMVFLQPRAVVDRQGPHRGVHVLAARRCLRPRAGSAMVVDDLLRSRRNPEPSHRVARRLRRGGGAPAARWRLEGRPVLVWRVGRHCARSAPPVVLLVEVGRPEPPVARGCRTACADGPGVGRGNLGSEHRSAVSGSSSRPDDPCCSSGAVRPWTWVRTPEVWLVLAGACIFLISFAQTPNFNHGGTQASPLHGVVEFHWPSPILQRAAGGVSLRSQRMFVPFVLASCCWCVAAFHPSRPERYKTPTQAASIIWERWPGLDNPLPESSRSGFPGEEPRLIPAATPGCSKVLLAGGSWPVPCSGRAGNLWVAHVTLLCQSPCRRLRLFIELWRGFRLSVDRQRRADVNMEPESRNLACRIPSPGCAWQDLRRVSQSSPGAMVRATHNVSWTCGLQSEAELLLYMAPATARRTR